VQRQFGAWLEREGSLVTLRKQKRRVPKRERGVVDYDM
jgi:hypothetical protein